MQDAIAQLCKIISEKLRDEPEVNQAELLRLVETAIAAKPQLEAALRANPKMLQINRDGAKGFQIQVEGGTANIGDHFHLSDPEKFQAALEGVLRKLQPPRKAGAPFQMPPLPAHFVERPEDEDPLKAKLLREDRVAPGTLVISAIHGLGGVRLVGK